MFARPSGLRSDEISFSEPHLRSTVAHECFAENQARKFCKENRVEAAVKLVFGLVHHHKISASPAILYHLLQGCIAKKRFALGATVHQLIKRSGFFHDSFLGSHLIRMYGECGRLKEAFEVFKELPNAAVYAWSAHILAHAKLGQGEEALKLFADMQTCSGIWPNAYTFVAVLKACASRAALMKGMVLHSFAVESFLDSDIHLCNTLVGMYAKCNNLNNARAIFDRLDQRSLVTWNAMISGYAQQGHGNEACTMFDTLLQEKQSPDKVTLMSVLKACATTENAYPLSMLVHFFMVETGHEADDCLKSSLIDMYTQCGDFAGAWNVFGREQAEHSVVIWNAMIAGCANQGWLTEGLCLFCLMQKSYSSPDMVTLMSILRACAWKSLGDDGRIIHAFIVENFDVMNTQLGNTVLDMYAKCGSVYDAHRVFQMLPKDNVVTWTAMIGAHVYCRKGNEAFQCFQCMQEEGVDPNEATYAIILKACFMTNSKAYGKLLHADVVSAGLEVDYLVGGALVDMYSKCGAIDDAAIVFANLSKRSVVTWSSMFAGLAMNGHHGRAWQCLQEMQLEGIKPDSVTMVSLLSACSHSGLSEEGCAQFKSTFPAHSSIPWMEHYSCLLQLLVHAGCLTEARSLFETMPVPSDNVGWMSLLQNCQHNGSSKFAHGCFGHVTSL